MNAKGNRVGRQPGAWGDGLSSDVVRSFRETGAVSRARLAGLLGVSSTTIQNWETGLAVPDPKNQAKLREVIKAGVPAATAMAATANAKAAVATGLVDAAVGEATGKIVTGYVAKAGPMTVEQLCELVRAVKAALL